ncbi:MAG: glycosyltransferase family 2 protein [Burkholderiales bacterium]|jgi:GT2 family glycosyltransferase|nr:glycosyltransferase family 2 protein [Burkholderiales bacterium]
MILEAWRVSRHHVPRLGVAALAAAVVRKVRREGIAGLVRGFRDLAARAEDERTIYAKWVAATALTTADIERMRESIDSFSRKPRFSIAVPVYNVDARWLESVVASVRAQVYPYWELCLADDASTEPHIRPMLERFCRDDARIRAVFRQQNGHISEATNSAIEIATGDYVVLVDNDDEIAPESLFEFARVIDREGLVDMIYSDEDKLSVGGDRFEPFFKPHWSPEYLETCMYTAHLACYRTDLFRAVGGFRKGYEGAQDYDFVLRFTERASRILHVEKVLYHWRVIPGSTALALGQKKYVVDAGCRALSDRLSRTGRDGVAQSSPYPGCFWIEEKVSGEPLVSIVIPSAGRDARIRGRATDLLVNCVKSLRSKTDYRNYEIIVVDNDDLRSTTRQFIEANGCRLVHFREPFNVARKMNLGARESRGELLLFMNDDIEVINPEWLRRMIPLVQRAGVGVVGAKLLFESGKIQHVGVAFDDDGLPDHVLRGFHGDSQGYFFSVAGNRDFLAVTGACMLTPKPLFESIGGFDEAFAINYNDIDYCLKAHHAGYRSVYTPHARLYHFESQNRERVVAPQEIELFLQRWADTTKRDPYYGRMFRNKPPDFRLRPVGEAQSHQWK